MGMAVTILTDIIHFGIYYPLNDFAAERGRDVFRFSAAMAILNLLLKPVSCFFVYQMYRERGGDYNVNFGKCCRMSQVQQHEGVCRFLRKGYRTDFQLWYRHQQEFKRPQKLDSVLCSSIFKYDLIPFWEAEDTENNSTHDKTRFHWANTCSGLRIISEPVRTNLKYLRFPFSPQKKGPQPRVWPKARCTVWCMCPGALWDPPYVVLCHLSWKACLVQHKLGRLCAKPLADDSTVKLISYSHKTFQMQQNIWAAVRPGKEIISPRVVYNICVSSWPPIYTAWRNILNPCRLKNLGSAMIGK